MPIYEYKCQKCGQLFEELVKNGQEIKCPKCKTTHLQRKFSTFSKKGSSEAESGSSSACSGCTSGDCGTCSVG